MIDHDPGDEDRSYDGPWRVRCGDAFEAPERPCPNPAAPMDRWLKDCGRGGHMLSAREPVGIVSVPPDGRTRIMLDARARERKDRTR